MFQLNKGLLLLPLTALCLAGAAQNGQPTAKPADSTAVKKTTVKSYKDVITTKAVSQWGMFGVHKVDDKYYFEIPDSLLKREILVASRLAKTPAGNLVKFPGEVVNTKSIAFEKAPGDKIFLRVITYVNEIDTTQTISRAVTNASVDPIVMAFDIKALSDNKRNVVIEVTDFFKNENIVTGFSADSKKFMRIGGVAADRSYLMDMRAYPSNIEVKSMRTYSAGGPGAPAAGGEQPAADAGGGNEAGSVTLELNTSMLLLPKTPMRQRAADPRIGYFDYSANVFTDAQQQVDKKSYIIRHRMEPKPEDRERYRRGELVEPQKPIVFYVDPATPKQWRPFIIQGINDWQKAFEAAGFKNAIVGKEWPEQDTTMQIDDIRYFTVRYFPGQQTNAYGRQISDPRSGEILASYVGWYHNLIRLLHDMYFMQAGAQDPAARSMVFNDTLMGKLVRMAVCHEIGHTLGLAHNMGASHAVPVEKMRDKNYLKAHSHTASIMDYARFNYVAQPEDNIPQDLLIPRMGEYDTWAIKWGYTWLDGVSADEEKIITRQWLTDSLKSNPRLWFGGEGRNEDPRAMAEDLGDNNIKAAVYGMKNLKKVTANLEKYTREDFETYENLMTMYDKVGAEMIKYIDQAQTQIGGVYENQENEFYGKPVYRQVPEATQKSAVAFLNTEIFKTPSWMLNSDMLNKFRKPGRQEWPQKVQEMALGGSLSLSLLNRLALNEKRFGPADAYTLDEYMTDLGNGIFEEVYSKKPIDNYRRYLQKKFVVFSQTIMNNLARTLQKATDGPEYGTTDIPAVLINQLKKIRQGVRTALPAATDAATRSHLQYIDEYIGNILKESK